jgi:3-oxoacyl-[acyl-carrier protein] reductase
VAVTHFKHEATDLVAQAEAFGGSVHDFPLDAADSAEVESVVDQAADRLGGRIDALVNNAGGLVARVSIAHMQDEHWHNVIDLNLSSMFYCTRAALRHMPDGGRIVNISSLAARTGGGAGSIAYATAKAGMEGFTRAAAKDLAARHILVNAVAPGFITDTPFHATFTPPAAQQATVEALPVGRPGYPADVAGAVLYLVSPLAAFCTGITLDVSGGAY